MIDHDLNYLRKTTGSILRIDHTYKFTKCLGAYDTSESKNPQWVNENM
jgi:hypothetical protein